MISGFGSQGSGVDDSCEKWIKVKRPPLGFTATFAGHTFDEQTSWSLTHHTSSQENTPKKSKKGVLLSLFSERWSVEIRNYFPKNVESRDYLHLFTKQGVDGSFQSFELIISWSEIQVPCHQMGPETPMRSNKRIEVEVRCPNLFPSLDLDVGNSKGEVCTKHDTNIFQQIVSNQSAPKR